MSRKTEDLTGKKFGKLTVIGRDGSYKSGNVRWLCKCDCGGYTHTLGCYLKSGTVKGCSCVSSERMKRISTKHGGFGTRLYEIWRQMHRRCYGKYTKAYPHYGGRGIAVCDEWREFEPFRDWGLSHGYSDDLTIDRIDVNGNYCPENCRWATDKEQANNKRNNHFLKFNGEKHTVSEWADRYGVEQRKLFARLQYREWDLKAALESLGVNP